MNAVGKQKVFLSYARADGREAAARLRQALSDSGFDLWQDVYSMEGGAEWWPQIELAIRSVDAVVALITLRSFKSEVLRREWVQARRSGTPIFPVTYEADVFKAAPSWMGKYDIYILADSNPDREIVRKRFLDQLSSPPARRPVPFMALPLPRQYAPRARPFEELLGKVLDESHTGRRPGVVAIQGGPGFGKTTLARALCHAPEVIEGFTDGVLWATVGERGQNLAAQLNEMVGALTGAATRFDTPEEAAARLHALVADRDCLLVLDDVWDASHVKLFLDNPALTVLITTRQSEVINVTMAEPLFVEAMSPEEALQVLVNWLPEERRPQALEPGPREGLTRLAARLGEWPLLLNIFGTALRGETKDGRTTVAQALELVNEGLDEEGLVAFQPGDSDDRERALDASMRASLRAFDEREVRRLQELSVFREDDAVPEEVAVRLWEATAGVSRYAARKLLRRLEGQFFQMRVEREGGPKVLRFHDALREYLAGRLGREASRAAHGALLDSYNPSARPWHEVEDDGYLYDHLVYHLDGAGRGAEVWRLFDDDEWMRARFANDGYSYTGFVEDLANAAGVSAGDFAADVAALVRAALLRSTVNSISANYVPALVGRAVELGMWTPERALSVAERNPDPASKALIYDALWSVLAPDDKRREALRESCRAAVVSLKDPGDVVDVLSALPAGLREGWGDVLVHGFVARLRRRPGVPFGPHDFFARLAPLFSEQLLKEFLDGVARAPDSQEVLGDFARAAARLPAGPARLAFNFARRSLEPGERTKALTAMLPRLEGEERAQALSEILDALSRAEVRKGEVPVSVLPEIFRRTGAGPEVLDLLDRHVAFADARDAEGDGNPALRRLQRHLDGSDGERYVWGLEASISEMAEGQLRAEAARALERALPHALEQLRVERRAAALADIAACLPDELLRDCLRDALAMRDEAEIDEPTRARVLAKLAPHLRDEESRRLCLEAALADKQHWGRAAVIVALAPRLDEATRLRGAKAALRVRDPEQRARLLLGIARHLPPTLREKALRLCLRAAKKIPTPGSFSALVGALGMLAEGELLQSCVDELLLVESAGWRNEGLTRLAPRLSCKQVRQCFGHSLTIQDMLERCRALAGLLRDVPGGEKRELLRLLLDSLQADQDSESFALAAIAPQLKDDLADRALDKVVLMWTRPQRWEFREPEDDCVEALERLAPSLTVEQLRRAVKVVEDVFKDASSRPRGIVALNAELLKRGAGPAAEAEAEDLLRLALGIKKSWARRPALLTLLPLLDGGQRLRAIEALPALSDAPSGEELTRILPSLDSEAARALMGRTTEGYTLNPGPGYARALLATRLDEPERTQRLLEVFALLPEVNRYAGWFDATAGAGIYVTLLRHLRGADHERVFEAALVEPNEEVRVAVLAALAPGLEGEDFRRALDSALGLTELRPRVRALPAFLSGAPDGEKLKGVVLEALRGYLSSVQQARRGVVLRLYADPLLFGAPAFGPASLKAVAEEIVEVCWRWRWQ